MLEKPNISDETLIACLHDSYNIRASSLEFLPIGNDATACVYRVTTSTDAHFLKLKKGTLYTPSLAVPRYLHDAGMEQVVAPLRTLAGDLCTTVETFSLILYPFIEGEIAARQAMSPAQWHEFAVVLRRFHAVQPFAELSDVRRETFIPKWAALVKKLHAQIAAVTFNDYHARDLAAFWQQKRADIERIVARTEHLGRLLQTQSPPFVLCHADIHLHNVLIDSVGRLHIVDWDETLFAPKERDLMFMGAGLGSITPQQALFYEGYGAAAIDPLAAAYYHYEWVVQELGDFGERVFLSDAGADTKQDAVRGFRQLFDAGDVVDVARAAEEHLPPEYQLSTH